MTNYRDQEKYSDILSEGDVQGQKLVSDLSELYMATVPPLQFEERRVERASNGWLTGLLRAGWRPAVGGAMVAAVAAAALLSLSPWSAEREVSAETILARTSEAAENNAPLAGAAGYHLVATMGAPSEESLSTTETWYADSSHLRTETRWTEGEQTADFGLAVNGDEAWLYGTFDGVFRVANGPATELGTTFGGPSQARDVAQVLGQYVGGCQTAQQVGEETVANRTAYKIRVTPDASACPEMAGVPAKDVIAKLGVLTVWVDKETFLPLRTEQATPDGGVSIYTVTQIEVGGDIGESTFAYEAPEGVAVQEVANLTEAKNVLSGYVPDSTPPTPPEPKD